MFEFFLIFFSLLKVIGNILLTPLGKLRFREFFLTDILTSMVKVFVDIGYTLCFIGSGLFLESINIYV